MPEAEPPEHRPVSQADQTGQRLVHVDHRCDLGRGDSELLQMIPEDQSKLLEHWERAQLERDYVVLSNGPRKFLTFDNPAAQHTIHPNPPSGATKSGPSCEWFLRFFFTLFGLSRDSSFRPSISIAGETFRKPLERSLIRLLNNPCVNSPKTVGKDS